MWGGTTEDQRRAIRSLAQAMPNGQEDDDARLARPPATRDAHQRAASGFMTGHAEALAAGWHEARSVSRLRYVFARDFATADGHRVVVAALTPRQFADLATAARLARTFAFLERLLPADFSTRGDLYTHRVTLAALLAPWFARRTVADLAAAFAGTSVPWAHADQVHRRSGGRHQLHRRGRQGSGHDRQPGGGDVRFRPAGRDHDGGLAELHR